ncbi:RidA family protein [Anaerosacchariphilus sp. NSJ-68]|uniref:RidA family protein n=2 Tax=Lachnospiraceae TaxID=186803 RepID=A0A923LBT1_9FIRM|nr:MULTISPECIES: RidA family protein [Lachnospiraceae]MBC5659461.1 RidA family protein [Anaerosacchariphilus hominis]MBC5697127.1 RidA family protein [Roseburia difficilis]
MKKVIATTNAPAAIGPYSQAIEYNGMVYASGQIPVNPATGQVESDNIEGQADQSLKNVGAILKEAGLDYSNVIKTTCFLADIADFAKFNEVYSRYFKEEAPARSCVAVKDLPKGVLCEVEVIAGR